MLDIVRKELNISIISSIVYIIIGAIIITNPAITLSIVSIAVAILSIIYGIILVVINITNIKEGGHLIYGVLLVVLGIALLVYPNSLNVLISLGVGIWFISSSVSRIKFAVLLKNADGINWFVILSGAIVTLLIGITFIFAPLASAIALTTVSGILMIAYAIFDICEIIFIKKNISAVEKALK